ncbi:hypothetical protein GCM10009676_34480 [Prauserella halophila]|uniref:DUF998 domain-containing protein n=1 Tax=Prauserella halophila TaxID=185641 RepID=A0ABN1WER8_9PSEU|nr:DUF998 domain-containing protein [Prauserella halophila]MCP2238438.1 Protein of unknown function (DUF998) [Prauserella halophila]
MLPELRGPTTLTAVRRVGMSLLVIAIIGQLGWVAEFVLSTDMSPSRTVTSALAVPGQPYAPVFRAVELVAGVALVLAVPPLLRIAPVDNRARVTVLLLGMLGLLYLVRGICPLECQPMAGGVCTPDPDPSLGGQLHIAASILVNVFCSVGPVALLTWWYGRWTILPTVGVVLGTVAWLLLVLDDVVGPGEFAGLASRGQLISESIVVGAGVAYLHRTGHDRAGGVA